jgi:hypothetical protein
MFKTIISLTYDLTLNLLLYWSVIITLSLPRVKQLNTSEDIRGHKGNI